MKKISALVIAASVLVGGSSVYAGSSVQQVQSAGDSYNKVSEDSLNYLNSLRSKIGVRELKLNPYLTKAAENHANYLYTNDEYSHNESSSNKGYTGYAVGARVLATGAPTDLSRGVMEVITKGKSSASEFLDYLLSAPYHRYALINQNALEVGFAQAGDIYIAVISKKQDAGDSATSVYPYPDQVSVPTSFDGRTEVPNPLEKFNLRYSGYVMSFSSQYLLKDIDASVKDSKGNVVPIFKESDALAWHLYPKTELKPSEKYTVSINYIPNLGPNEGQTLNKTWSFTTETSDTPTPPAVAPPATTPTNPVLPKPPVTGGTVAKYSKDNVGVLINGVEVELNPKATIVDGSTFIPLRGVFEKMNSDVKWDQKTKTVTVARGNTTVKLTLGKKVAYVNGKAITLTAAPFMTASGSTYVPLRFVSETIGALVGWDQTNYIASINIQD